MVFNICDVLFFVWRGILPGSEESGRVLLRPASHNNMCHVIYFKVHVKVHHLVIAIGLDINRQTQPNNCNLSGITIDHWFNGVVVGIDRCWTVHLFVILYVINWINLGAHQVWDGVLSLGYIGIWLIVAVNCSEWNQCIKMLICGLGCVVFHLMFWSKPF